MNYRLISYAMDFTSFLLEKTSFNDKIRNIILFGSVARSEESPNSDIDIFIDITEENKKSGSPLVKKIEIIDVFEDEKIGTGKKSVTLRLTYQRSDRTPTQKEVTLVREKISARLTKTFRAQIRK